MNRIAWCVKKKAGLTLLEPNNNLSKAYTKKAEEALESISYNRIKDWKISTAYYAIYFSLYSLVTKIGFKCEIHSCTIEFVKTFLKQYFTDKEVKFIENSLKARIDSQYYTDKTIPDKQYEDMLLYAPRYLVKSKSILIKLNEKRIKQIRLEFQKEVKTLKNNSKPNS